MSQGGLFGKPSGRSPRGWTDLDRIRARIERLLKVISETGGTERDLIAIKLAKEKLAETEQKARGKWKDSFRE
jgi:hypothetical protein